MRTVCMIPFRSKNQTGFDFTPFDWPFYRIKELHADQDLSTPHVCWLSKSDLNGFSSEMQELLFDSQNNNKRHFFFEADNIKSTDCSDPRFLCVHVLCLDNGTGVLTLVSDPNMSLEQVAERAKTLLSSPEPKSDPSAEENILPEKAQKCLQFLVSRVSFLFDQAYLHSEAADGISPGYYSHLAMVAQLQRATLEHLFACSREHSIALSNELAKWPHTVTKKRHDKVQKLYANYIKARNALFLHRPATDPDGAAFFSKLQADFLIPPALDDLKEKIESLYALSHVYTEQRQNKVLSAIALVGLPLTLVPLLTEAFTLLGFSSTLGTATSWGIAMVALSIFWLWYRGLPSRKKN